jgi:hypothetical protein
MRDCIRHCVECPTCLTRYLVAASPYGNGSYLVSTASGPSDECILFCACRKPPTGGRWRWPDVKKYTISKPAQFRGYGTPAEIVLVGEKENGRGAAGLRDHATSAPRSIRSSRSTDR